MFRRAFDVVVASTLLLLLLPVMLGVAVLVHLFLGSPVFFTQVRPGRFGEPFTLIKFRTMRDAVDSAGNPLPDEERMTRFGQLLRSTSLDELPELINVLRGEMSIVGPRPLLVEYLPLYSPVQARRHLVKPGLTGLAQVSGRNALPWNERLALDVYYVDHHSLRLDAQILARTVRQVAVRDGIAAEGYATAPWFTGTAE
jgi:lipopolysaccharide/colanic/teichoic acid biosynthesis glycosyltransferase